MSGPGPREAVPRAYAAGVRRGRTGLTIAGYPTGNDPRSVLLRHVFARGYAAGRALAGIPLAATIDEELTTPAAERVAPSTADEDPAPTLGP